MLGDKRAGRKKSVYCCGRQKSWEAKECCFQSWAEKECLAKGGKDSLLLNVAKVREEMELQPKNPNLYFSRISLEPLELQKSFLHLFAFLFE